MSANAPRASGWALVWLASVPSAALGRSDVRIVDASGGGDHTSLQEAVDAAADGDVLIVRAGTYPAFALSGKGLAVVARDAGVTVIGTCAVRLLPDASAAVLSGFEMRATDDRVSALEVSDAAGDVRVLGCTLRGAAQACSQRPSPALSLADSDRVALAGCLLTGGDGCAAEILGYPGGPTVELENSSLVLHDTELRPGDGGMGWDGAFYCGSGGTGGFAVYAHSTSTLYASGGSFVGGAGGPGDSCFTGQQGYALIVFPDCEAHLLDVELDGPVYGEPVLVPGAARRLEVSPLGTEGLSLELALHGRPGDDVHLIAGTRPGFRPFSPAVGGPLLVDEGELAIHAAGTVPDSGVLLLPLPAPKLEQGVAAAVLHLQALFRPRGRTPVLSSPGAVVSLDGSFPDCDGDGRPDTLALASDPIVDCDGNGVPDDCDVASGVHADCNGNGVPDPCDLHFRAVSAQLSPFGSQDPQSWLVAAPPPAAGDVHLRLRARADLGEADERARVRLNGLGLGWSFETGASDCPHEPDAAEIVVPAATFEAAVGGGDALFELLPSSAVDSGACQPPSWIQLELSYEATQPIGDCNGDGVPDECQPAGDCNANGVEDLCDLGSGASVDCNANAVPDECDVGSGASLDCNANGIPDECDLASGASTDVDGNGQPDDCQRSPILFVDASQSGAADGLSWATALPDLADALALADVQSTAGVEVWVREGTYRPAPPGGEREARFLVGERVRLYGGFAGGESSLSQRDVEAHPTVLCGDLDGDDLPDFGNRWDNSVHVVEFAPGSGAVLDGFTVRGGNAHLPKDPYCCIGGGVHATQGEARVVGCTFLDNSAYSAGGAVGAYARLTLLDCTFLGNRSEFGGGAVYCRDARISGCRFVRNSAPENGGAVAHAGGGGATLLLVDCLFHDNEARRGGAIAAAPGTGLSIHSSTLARNRATELAGGLFVTGSSGTAALYNCVLWGNDDGSGDVESAQLWIAPAVDPIVSHCEIEGLFLHAGNGNLELDPRFADPFGPDGLRATLDDDFRLAPGSPCIDSGDRAALPADALDLDGDGDSREPWPVDLDGGRRVVDDPLAPDAGPGPPPHLDRGAYERRGS